MEKCILIQPRLMQYAFPFQRSETTYTIAHKDFFGTGTPFYKGLFYKANNAKITTKTVEEIAKGEHLRFQMAWYGIEKGIITSCYHCKSSLFRLAFFARKAYDFVLDEDDIQWLLYIMDVMEI
ncbi:hypothetical protein CEXT_617981 [Caerostris extrusa]|uniref:Uncharacterized protein n=1 Tax=Caerostris extrusa TaxID=172846 RepID=A0AAV4QY34_CAEEX|nr:hypothetical protein CEXT_617981 [Caerostris extrusa]